MATLPTTKSVQCTPKDTRFANESTAALSIDWTCNDSRRFYSFVDKVPAIGEGCDMPLFTRENAREYALRGNAVRWSQEKAAAQSPATTPQVADPVADDFVARKVARVRGQIERIEGLLDEADEPQAVDRFANALSRLYELEANLSGRPKPGSFKPVAPKPSANQKLKSNYETTIQAHTGWRI